MTNEVVHYRPPPTIKEFITHFEPGVAFNDWIVGPVGSGKTTSLFMKLILMAKKQERSPDGVRYSRAVVVRNTAPMLRDTTLVSWDYWFKPGQAGHWAATDKIFTVRIDDICIEVLFRPLDTPQDVGRVLSLEVTFILIDEFVEIPKAIIDALGPRAGRWKAPGNVPATNWGMWGSSNPSTEDVWWHDYLHDPVLTNYIDLYTPRALVAAASETGKPEVINHYYHQPSGLSEHAENLENLPGKREYYTRQMLGKTKAWIKQFIEAEWGFSISGTPVISTFNPEWHVAKHGLIFNPHRLLVVGCDPGLAGTTFVFMQEDEYGRLLVLRELGFVGLGMERILDNHFKPFVRRHFPDARIMFAPDPAANNRAQTDERTVVEVIRRSYDAKIETNNRLPMRINAYDHFLTKLTPIGPGFLIDATGCPMLTRALKGGWRWEIDRKRAEFKNAEPEKNAYSHFGDGGGYGARYFHRQTEREMRGVAVTGKRFTPPRTFNNGYHHV